jgi:hypothetical protein
VRPAVRSLPLHASSCSFQMIPVFAFWISWREFSRSAVSMLSQTYMTISSTFFSPQIALGSLETLLKKPGAATDVSLCILFAFVIFFRGLRTYLVGVRWSVDSSSSCMRHAYAISWIRCDPCPGVVLAWRCVQVSQRIVKLLVRSEDVERPVLVKISVPS